MTHSFPRDKRPACPSLFRLHRDGPVVRCIIAMILACAIPAVAQVDPTDDDLQPGRRRPGQGQPGEAAPPPPPPAPPPGTAAKTETKEPDRYLAITGGQVFTVSGPILRNADILIKNGKILQIGHGLTIPEGAERLDATGHRVYPGLIAVQSQGVIGTGDPSDSTNMFTLNTVAALAAGITSALGDNVVGKVMFGRVDDMVVRRDVFVNLSYSTRNPSGRRSLRESFDRLRQHLREVEAHEEAKRTDPTAKAPDDRWIRGEHERNLKLLKGESIALFTSSNAAELVQICNLVTAYRLRAVILGADEAWTVAPHLARAGVGAIVTPRRRSDPDDRLLRESGSTIRNASILHSHGVPVAFVPIGSLFGPGSAISFGGLGGRDLLHIPMEAAFAVRGGLPEDAAIRGLTLDAARLLGIDKRVGSIEVGKDGDLIVVDGDLLHYQTLVRWTVVNGHVMYDKEKETLYSHIRPDGDQDAPAPTDYWPRRLGDPIPEPGP